MQVAGFLVIAATLWLVARRQSGCTSQKFFCAASLGARFLLCCYAIRGSSQRSRLVQAAGRGPADRFSKERGLACATFRPPAAWSGYDFRTARLAREGKTAFENDLQTDSALAVASGSPHRGSAIIADDVIPGAFIQVRHEAHSFDLAARAAALDYSIGAIAR
jgi:hypothetical protein